MAALEFAFVGPVFILLMLIIFDGALMMFQQAVLDNATRVAARPFLTGSATPTISSFDTALCNAAAPLIPCSQISFQVTSEQPTCSTTTNPCTSPVMAQFSTGLPATSLTAVAPTNGAYSCTHATVTSNGSCTFVSGAGIAPVSAYLVQVAFNRSYEFQWVAKISQISYPTVVSTLAFLSEPYCNANTTPSCTL